VPLWYGRVVIQGVSRGCSTGTHVLATADLTDPFGNVGGNGPSCRERAGSSHPRLLGRTRHDRAVERPLRIARLTTSYHSAPKRRECCEYDSLNP